MGKIITLKNNRDFKRAYIKGRSYISRNVVTYIVKNKKKQNRFGITTSKKIGNAVLRNRARRVIKSAYLSIQPDLKKVGYDFVFVARTKTLFTKSNIIANIMTEQFKQAGIL